MPRPLLVAQLCPSWFPHRQLMGSGPPSGASLSFGVDESRVEERSTDPLRGFDWWVSPIYPPILPSRLAPIRVDDGVRSPTPSSTSEALKANKKTESERCAMDFEPRPERGPRHDGASGVRDVSQEPLRRRRCSLRLQPSPRHEDANHSGARWTSMTYRMTTTMNRWRGALAT